MFGIKTRSIFPNSFNYKTCRKLIISPLIIAAITTFSVNLLQLMTNNDSPIHQKSQFVTNINLSESFQKPESKQNPEKPHTWSFGRLSRTCNFFNGNQWIVLESKQFVTQTTQNIVRIWNFLCLCFETISFIFWASMFQLYTQLRHVHQLAQINYFHQALFLAYRLRDVSLKYMLSILFSFGTRIPYASLLEQLESWYAYSLSNVQLVTFSSIGKKDFKIHNFNKNWLIK